MTSHVVLELESMEDGGTPVRVHRDDVVIGRSQGADVPVEDPSASRQHARLHRRGDAFEIENLSSNGTQVNGKAITTRVLKDGDVIQIGQATRLKVRYLTQTGTVVAHQGDNAASDAAAFGTDDDAGVVRPAPAARPSLFLRPKVLVGLSAYFVCLLAVCIVLNTREPTVVPPAGLGRADIEKMMEDYFGPTSQVFEYERDGARRAADPKKERAALERAREAFNTAPVSGQSLWTAASRYREAQAYNPDHAMRDPADARRFRQAKERLTEVLSKKYVQGLSEYKRERYKDASKTFQELLDILPERQHPLAQNVGQWLQIISRKGSE